MSEREDPYRGLSAREREIMDIVHRLQRATAREVEAEMASAPSNATVRSTLTVLEDKGWLEHKRDAGRFIYRPVHARETVRRNLLQHMIHTFFDDSPASLVAALVDRRQSLSPAERDRIQELLGSIEDPHANAPEDGGTE